MKRFIQISIIILAFITFLAAGNASDDSSSIPDRGTCNYCDPYDAPDLVVTDIFWSDSEAVTDDKFWIGVQVENIGYAYAGSNYVDIYLENIYSTGTDYYLGSLWIQGLYAGETQVYYLDFFVPYLDLDPTFNRIVVDIDSDQDIVEMDEENTFISGRYLEIKYCPGDRPCDAWHDQHSETVTGAYYESDAYSDGYVEAGCFVNSLFK